jgi:hypothetical protein
LGVLKRELEVIGHGLALPSGDVTFAPEREARELIRNLLA